MNVSTTLKEVSIWPVSERIEVMHGLWQSLIVAGREPALSDDQKAELGDAWTI